MSNQLMVGSLIWFEGQKVEVGNPLVIYFVLVGGVLASFAVAMQYLNDRWFGA